MIGKSRSLDMEGRRFHFMDWGRGEETILLIHGDMRTSRSFDALSRRLSNTFRVVSLDLLGHGESDWPNSGYRFKDKAENIGQFMRMADLKNVTAAAHSSGAVALSLQAKYHPNQFKRLILMEPMLVVDEAFQRMVSKRGSLPRTTWATRNELAELLTNHEITKKWSTEVIDDVVNHETYFNEEGRLDMKWAGPTVSWKERRNDYIDLLPVLELVKCPTLFISSSRRKSTFSEASKISVERNHFSFSVVKNTGHNMYMERPDAVSKLVSDFCSGKKPPKEI